MLSIIEKGMSSELARRLFEAQGWQVTELEARKAPLVKVTKGMPFGCGDGRRNVTGPSVLGGAYLRAMYTTGGNYEGLLHAARDIHKQGFIPTVHGDHEGEFACGMRKLWIAGTVGRHPYKLSDDDIRILARTGTLQIEIYPGEHGEKSFWVNLAKGWTISPSQDYFRTDVWAASLVGLSAEELINTSIDAVSRLSHGNVRQATIIRP